MLSNAYDFLQLLRDNVGEGTASHWSDLNLLRRLNQAYYETARLISMSSGQWLVKSATVTPSSSVITLPDDCSKPVYLEDANGSPVRWLTSVGQRRVSRSFGSGYDSSSAREAYPLMDTIELNESGYSSACTLWYQQRVVDLQTGTASAGDDLSLTFQASMRARQVADYYNGTTIEVISGTGPGIYTIDDYTSASVCTLSASSFDTDSVYGTVPVTPQETNDVIILRATLLAMSKPSSNMDEKVFQMFSNDFRDAKKDLKEWIENRVIENTGVEIGEPYL